MLDLLISNKHCRVTVQNGVFAIFLSSRDVSSPHNPHYLLHSSFFDLASYVVCFDHRSGDSSQRNTSNAKLDEKRRTVWSTGYRTNITKGTGEGKIIFNEKGSRVAVPVFDDSTTCECHKRSCVSYLTNCLAFLGLTAGIAGLSAEWSLSVSYIGGNNHNNNCKN